MHTGSDITGINHLHPRCRRHHQPDRPATAIADLLDQLGGLVAIEATLTDDERRAVLEESNLSIRYNYDTRTVLFKVDLARGVSVCVGGGTWYKTPRRIPDTDLWLPAA